MFYSVFISNLTINYTQKQKYIIYNFRNTKDSLSPSVSLSLMYVYIQCIVGLDWLSSLIELIVTIYTNPLPTQKKKKKNQ